MLLDWQLGSVSRRAQESVNKKIDPPTTPATRTAVRIPAPALSAVVIGGNTAESEFCELCLVPAFGSLEPFPPVAVETGVEDKPRNFTITALII